MALVNVLAQEATDPPPALPTHLTGIAAWLVPLIAAIFVGLSKLISLFIAGRKERAQIVANAEAGDLRLKLVQAEMKYDALLTRYNDLKEAFNELKTANK